MAPDLWVARPSPPSGRQAVPHEQCRAAGRSWAPCSSGGPEVSVADAAPPTLGDGASHRCWAQSVRRCASPSCVDHMEDLWTAVHQTQASSASARRPWSVAPPLLAVKQPWRTPLGASQHCSWHDVNLFWGLYKLLDAMHNADTAPGREAM